MNDLTRRHLVTGALGAATTGTMIAMTSPAYAVSPPSAVDLTVRIATFNASLNRNAAGDLVRDLSTSGNVQARVIAEIIQRTDPDIILINEFDYVENGLAATLFRDNYPRVAQNGAPPSTSRTSSPPPPTPASPADSTSTTTGSSAGETTTSASGCSRGSTAWSHRDRPELV